MTPEEQLLVDRFGDVVPPALATWCKVIWALSEQCRTWASAIDRRELVLAGERAELEKAQLELEKDRHAFTEAVRHFGLVGGEQHGLTQPRSQSAAKA
jgi:hypothetical protein